jgi:hypothetical protein
VVFYNAVVAAEAVRQASKVAAFNTWAFQPGAPAVTYVTALADADVACITAVNSAADTSNLLTGTVGHTGPIPWSISASIVK